MCSQQYLLRKWAKLDIFLECVHKSHEMFGRGQSDRLGTTWHRWPMLHFWRMDQIPGYPKLHISPLITISIGESISQWMSNENFFGEISTSRWTDGNFFPVVTSRFDVKTSLYFSSTDIQQWILISRLALILNKSYTSFLSDSSRFSFSLILEPGYRFLLLIHRNVIECCSSLQWKTWSCGPLEVCQKNKLVRSLWRLWLVSIFLTIMRSDLSRPRHFFAPEAWSSCFLCFEVWKP